MNPGGQRQHATDGFRWEAALPADQMFLDFKGFFWKKLAKMVMMPLESKIGVALCQAIGIPGSTTASCSVN